jgi:hypothetical protein
MKSIAAQNQIKINAMRIETVGYQRLMPVILATQEAEIRRIEVQSQPRQIVHQTLS